MQQTHTLGRVGAAALMVGFLLAAGGCLISSANSVEESGVAISSSTLGQVEAGKTSEAWLIATLGEPSSTTIVDGQPDVKVLRYDHVVTRKSSDAVFLVFGGQSKSKRVSRAYFEVEDGIVTRHWSEG